MHRPARVNVRVCPSGNNDEKTGFNDENLVHYEKGHDDEKVRTPNKKKSLNKAQTSQATQINEIERLARRRWRAYFNPTCDFDIILSFLNVRMMDVKSSPEYL